MSNSRLDYNWYSTNESVALISDYGTIIAISPGVTIITSICKNSFKKSYIIIIVEDDDENCVTEFNITLDLRSDGSIGTEVSSGNGKVNENTIRVGYTRLISLTEHAPYNKIQSYIWTSEDPTIASVSEFGTIKGLKPGKTIIHGQYKYNSNYIGSIIVQIY